SIYTVNSGCQITVTVNRVKPAQVATAGGPEGADDYITYVIFIFYIKITSPVGGHHYHYYSEHSLSFLVRCFFIHSL
ncbi:MAG: hypothetical protein WA421_00695, partial [Nitrososphaeraceae archaeon]